MCNVMLIRHGESQSNAGLPTTDPKNVELTQLGQQQAQRVARYLLQQGFSPDLIVTSSYLRTKQTAAYTEDLFPLAKVEEWAVEEFTYLSSMHQELSTTQDRLPLVQTYWEELVDPEYRDAGSESFVLFIKRVRAFIRRLRERVYTHDCHRTIAVFTHEQFINAVRWLIDSERVGEPLVISSQTMRDFRSYFGRFRIANGGIVGIKIRHNGYPWSHELLTEHLKPPDETFAFATVEKP
jgi:2,3-bisphosphoglycerate-dependent phosphoglycerate mutase